MCVCVCSGEHEVRCLRRKELLLELAKHLPKGTIRFCSKLLSISEENHLKVLHLADETIIKAKVLYRSYIPEPFYCPTSLNTNVGVIAGFNWM